MLVADWVQSISSVLAVIVSVISLFYARRALQQANSAVETGMRSEGILQAKALIEEIESLISRCKKEGGYEERASLATDIYSFLLMLVNLEGASLDNKIAVHLARMRNQFGDDALNAENHEKYFYELETLLTYHKNFLIQLAKDFQMQKIASGGILYKNIVGK